MEKTPAFARRDIIRIQPIIQVQFAFLVSATASPVQIPLLVKFVTLTTGMCLFQTRRVNIVELIVRLATMPKNVPHV